MPVTVKETVVDLDWFVVIEGLDIWELVMFPLIDRLNVEPLVVVAVTVDGETDGEAVGVGF